MFVKGRHTTTPQTINRDPAIINSIYTCKPDNLAAWRQIPEILFPSPPSWLLHENMYCSWICT